MSSATGFHFAEQDTELIHLVWQLRVTTVTRLSLLTNRSEKTLRRRLLKLCRHRYLAAITRFMEPIIYSIGPEGVEALVSAGFAPQELQAKRLRENELKPLGLAHALHVADIHARLILLSRESPITLSLWIPEHQALWDTVETDEGKLPVRPDAHFILENGGRKLLYFLEADMGSMGIHGRMAMKIKAYLAYYDHELHRKHHPSMRFFQVATITRTRKRAVELARRLSPLIPKRAQGAYHFIALEDLTFEALLRSLERPVLPSIANSDASCFNAGAAGRATPAPAAGQAARLPAVTASGNEAATR